MKLDIKKLLLAGTAIVAVGATSVTAQAATQTLTGNATWGTAANGMSGDPTSGDDVVLATHTLTIDASDAVRTIGAITSTTTGAVTITTATDADVTTTIGSIAITGAGNITSAVTDQTDRSIATNVTGGVSTGGNFVMTNVNNDGLSTNAFTVGGALTVGGTTAISTNTHASASTATLTVGGNATFTGAATLTGGSNAAADAILNLNGATNAFTAGITLDNGVAGDAHINLAGSTAQTVSGNIAAQGASEGNILVQNANGVTFSGTVGSGNVLEAIVIENSAALNSSATFQNTVGATNITLGGAGTGTNTITFDTTTQAFTATGAIAGAIAGETNNVVVSGGKTLTLATATGANLDNITVSGTGTILTTGQNLAATNTVIGSGAKLTTTGNTVTSAVANSGTLHLNGGSVAGNVTGAGIIDVDASGTITGNVAGTSADVATGQTLTVAGANTYSVTTTSLTGTGAITFGGAAQTVSGAITAAATGNGTVNIADGAGTVAFTNDIGTSTVKVGALTFADAATDQTVTTTGNLYVDAIQLDEDDSLQFIGTSAQVVSGTINSFNANSEGNIVVGNTAGTIASDVTFNGIIGGTANRQLEDLTVNDTAKATFAANATFDDVLSADKATIAVKSGATLTTNTQVDADITTWNVEVSRAGGDANNSTGKVAFIADAVNLAVDTVHFDVKANSAPLKVGTAALDNVFAGNAAATIAGATVTDSSFIYGFTLVADTNNVDVTVAVDNSVESVTDNSGYDATGNQLITTLAASTNTEINQLQSTLAAASTQSAANDVIEAAASDVAGGAVVAGVQVAGSTSAINNDRLASLRSGETGMNAGQVMHGLNAWIQGFGSQADQDKRDGVSGYDADTYGFAVGFDTQELAQDITVGLSFAYADTDVDSDAISKAKTEVDSYQLSLYGDYDLNETVFVTGQLGYIWSDNDTTRNPGGIAALSAKGSYNADAFVAGLSVGRDYHTGHGTLVLTPKVSADYMHYSADSYTETGAGGANLTVDADSLSLFEIGLGVEAEWDIQNANGTHLMPSIGLGVRHDLIGDEFEASNKFAGGGTAFKVKGFDPAQTTFDVGLGVKYITDTNWTLSAGYDFEFKSDYDSHAGMVKASYKF